VPEENIETTEPTNVDNSEISIEEPMEPGGDYTVKIDGAEHQVTLEELQQGYQRQADYTRKTQELASERQRLQQAETIVNALEADPQGTLDALGGALGVQGNPRTQDDTSWEDEDPTTQRVAQLEAQVAHQAKTHRQQALDKEVTRLKGVYGEFDERELFQHALNNKIANLEAAYAHKNFGTIANYAGQLQRDADALDAKRKGAPVEGGKSVQEGAVSTDKTKEPSTLREAFALAKQQLGN
jgi:hypothetical protein|tara:strand:+ start:6191 stop:6913 length:723 start_codon:yes stop_codon:yes gene_type:complete